MESMEASHRADMKRAADAIASLRDETDRLKAKVSQLDEENRTLEARFKLLVENLDWENDAPDPPPDSYWIEQGYDYGDEGITDEEYIEKIYSEFFEKSWRQSEDLRRGTFGLRSETLAFGNIDEDNETVIRYDDAMLPHWEEFCFAMRNWRFCSVRGTIEQTHPIRVYFCNIELPPDIVEKLRDCFFMPSNLGHVEKFHLARNEFLGSDGIEFAIHMIDTHKKMIDFRYNRNPVNNDWDCQRLVDAIVSHPNISTCHMEGSFGGEMNGHDSLVSLLRKEEMKIVDFSNCGIKTSGQSALFDIIKSHQKLDHLDLGNNKLDDDDAINLADALRYNKTLKNLFLHGNEFSLSGDDILKKVVYDDSSLNAVADSNHVCRIFGREFYNEDIYGGHICYVYRNDSHLGLQI